MRWLRQQSRVELLSFALQQNAGQMVRLRQRLKQSVHTRFRQPGTLVWAFAAGTLMGATRGGERGKKDASLFHYFNSALALWSLLEKYQSRQI